jgi:hypothetical protein
VRSKLHPKLADEYLPPDDFFVFIYHFKRNHSCQAIEQSITYFERKKLLEFKAILKPHIAGINILKNYQNTT